MSLGRVNQKLYCEAFPKCSDYINTFNEIYQLKSRNISEIKLLYQKIKNSLINTKILSPDEMVIAIPKQYSIILVTYNHIYFFLI